MSEIDSSDQASRYIRNICIVIEIVSKNNADAAVLEAVCSLAEAFLNLDPYTTSKSECYDPIFFLHIPWCNPSEQGVEQAAREFEATFSGESTADQIEILASLRNVLCAARQVPAIRESLRDPCNISNLINRALLYAFLTSATWHEMDEWDCFDIFLDEAWDASNEEKQKAAATHLQVYIENSSIEASESIFEALHNGRITTPNTSWDEA